MFLVKHWQFTLASIEHSHVYNKQRTSNEGKLAYITFNNIFILNDAGREAFLFPKPAIVLFLEPLWLVTILPNVYLTESSIFTQCILDVRY